MQMEDKQIITDGTVKTSSIPKCYSYKPAQSPQKVLGALFCKTNTLFKFWLLVKPQKIILNVNIGSEIS